MNILLLDDDPLVLAGLVRTLSAHLSVTPTSSATEAFEILATKKFDAVISDFTMPDIDGVSVLARVRELHPGTKRVLMSAGVVPDLEKHLASDLVTAFLDKPFTHKQLIDVLSR